MDTIFRLSDPQNPETHYKLQISKNPIYQWIDCIANLIVIDYYFVIKVGNLHPASLCDKPRIWWCPPLSSFVMGMFHGRLFVHLCVLNPESAEASICSEFSICSSWPFLLAARSNVVSLVRHSNKNKSFT